MTESDKGPPLIVHTTDNLTPLSLSLDTAPSFPSPSSTFVPPPLHPPQDFAALQIKDIADPTKPDDDHLDDLTPKTSESFAQPSESDPLQSSKTPTLPLLNTDLSQPQSQPTLSAAPQSSNRSSTSSLSLPFTSSRPAPPSPGGASHSGTSTPLRRRSKASASAGSPGGEKAGAATTASSSSPPPLSRKSSQRHRSLPSSRLSQSITSQEGQDDAADEPPNPPALPPPPPLILIRDFGFHESDERHRGLGSDVPKANRPRWINRIHYRRLDGSISDDEEEVEEEEEVESGDFGSRFGWGTGIVGGRTSDIQAASEAHFWGSDDDDEDEDEDPQQPLEEHEEEPLYAGVYRALYAFEPEGTAEMRLEEDQLVNVLGRGGGVGWAVVVRESDGGHALVPESYLELVQLDQVN